MEAVGWGRPLHYILDESGDPLPCDDVLVWAYWFKIADRHVAQECYNDDATGSEKRILVSTVFLGIDHAFHGGPPVLWETMVFGGELDGNQDRYTSKAAALKGHQRMCERVMETLR